MTEHNYTEHAPPLGSKLLLQKLVTVLYLLQILAGIVLCVCGTMSMKMAGGRTDTFGPPYYIGSFVVGGLMLLSGALWSIVYSSRRFLLSRKQRPKTYVILIIFINDILGVASLVTSAAGVVICGLYGLKKCTEFDVYFPDHQCNYSTNFQENHSLAILQVAFLSAVFLLSIFLVLVTSWSLYMHRLLPSSDNSSTQCDCRCFRTREESENNSVPIKTEEMEFFVRETSGNR